MAYFEEIEIGRTKILAFVCLLKKLIKFFNSSHWVEKEYHSDSTYKISDYDEITRYNPS